MSETTPKARKEHQCNICFQAIVSGERYHRMDLKPWYHHDNDGYYTFAFCRFCYATWNKHFRADQEEEFCLDDLAHEIKTKFREMAESILGIEIDSDDYGSRYSTWHLLLQEAK